jgi:uncharacterized protein YdhG (YjbR/CyaY superfamily)
LKNIDNYLSAVPESRFERVNELLSEIQKWYPKAELTMKYKMPTFELNGNWIAVANQKSYVSVYTCGYYHIDSYKKKHPETKSGKGCLNFRDKDKIHFKDLKDVVKSALTLQHKKGE